MKLTVHEDYFVRKSLERYNHMPKKIQGKLDMLNKKLHLLDETLLFNKYEGPVKEGDIFVVQVQKDQFLYGKILSTDVKLFDEEHQQHSDYVALFYKKSTNKVVMPKDLLKLDDLLMRPHLIKKYLFTSGFLHIVGNIPLTTEEINADIGFLNGYTITNSTLTDEGKIEVTNEEHMHYYNLDGKKIDTPPKILGSTKIKGLGIIYDIARELIISPDILDEPYNVTPDKEKNIRKMKRKIVIKEKNMLIEEITDKMTEFQKEMESYNKAMKNLIEDVRIVTYEFFENMKTATDEDEVQNFVKEYVLSLNDINAISEYQLIETDEREMICEFIFNTIDEFEFQFDDDITEKYREW